MLGCGFAHDRQPGQNSRTLAVSAKQCDRMDREIKVEPDLEHLRSTTLSGGHWPCPCSWECADSAQSGLAGQDFTNGWILSQAGNTALVDAVPEHDLLIGDPDPNDLLN